MNIGNLLSQIIKGNNVYVNSNKGELMKNQYVGDIGDYGKYGLLRYLSLNGVSIGVNWYLTENDGSTDGKFVSYLKNEKERIYDPIVYDSLKRIAFDKDKTVLGIENANLFSKVSYYHEILRQHGRDEWHGKALDALQDMQLVFCDPDNGPIGKKKLGRKDSEKYVAPNEMIDYYERGQDVVYYCQKARRTPVQWEVTKNEMRNYISEAEIIVLTYHRGTQRSYIFVVHPNRYNVYLSLIKKLLDTSWGDCFSLE